MSDRVVYDFPADFPFRVKLVHVNPARQVSGVGPRWRLVRQGFSVSEVLLAELEVKDLEISVT